MKQYKVLRMALYLAAAAFYWAFSPSAASAAPPNDPLYEKQQYLQQIHIPEAWEAIGERKLAPVKVAVVDTGVDLTHPDLEGRLVGGANIIDPKAPPQDDYGHGTSVTGIIAGITGNGVGIAGIAPNAQIMPVKAVNSNGQGEEEHLGQGIRYAVDHGADVVVLSLGLHLNSPYLAEVVRYAEQKGVLLIAAAGNEGKQVRYPAAYPTVVAVGGASVTNQYKTSSNFGPEIDLIAPWYVYTTVNGGGYTYKEGTSMAAPQVAGVAALMLGLQPELSVNELRERLRQSAEPVREGGWNPYTGYGLLQADKAITLTPKADMYEPSNRMSEAKPISVVGLTSGELTGKEDQDWYLLDPPYAGEISVRANKRNDGPLPIEMSVYRVKDGSLVQRYDLSSGNPVRFPVQREKVYLLLRSVSANGQDAANNVLSYQLSTEFHIYKDPFESNDKAFQAYSLPMRSTSITGTFHQVNDHDWYSIRVTDPGTINIQLDTDTPRIDPELYFAQDGQEERIVDEQGEGLSERLSNVDVKPGLYYIRVRNVKALYPLPVAGEYKLSISYEQRYFDMNEPNNRSYQAVTVVYGNPYKGVFDSSLDEDWFQFRLTRRSLVTINITGIPKDRFMYYSLYTSESARKASQTSRFGMTSMQLTHDLENGVYSVKLMTDAAYQNQQYTLRVNQEPLYGGFADIRLHWARAAIVNMADQGIVGGFGNYHFAPERTVTRAEAASMIHRAFNLKQGKGKSFSDLKANHWANGAIGAVSAAGIIHGYPDGTFRPNESVTRAEMAKLVAMAMKLPGLPAGGDSFQDVPPSHWAAPAIYELVNDGVLQGFPNGTFRPNGQATRAEFAFILAKALSS